MTWIDDIGTYLQTNSVGTLGTDVYYNGFSASSPNCIALFYQAGNKEEETASGDLTFRYPELGIRVRNASDASAKQKIDSIHALLHDISNTLIGSTYFVSIEAIADPFFVSQKNNQFIYSVNFSLEIEV